jgi:hypothetical protein
MCQEKLELHSEIADLEKNTEQTKKSLNNFIASNMQDEKANDKLRNQEVQAKEALVKIQR